jgi:hypothetical protein
VSRHRRDCCALKLPAPFSAWNMFATCACAAAAARLIAASTAREMLLHGGVGDDELRGDRADRRRLGERVAGEQRTAQRDEHVALARRERRRLRDRRCLRSMRRRVKQQAKSAEHDLVAGVQSALADDAAAVHERAVARPRSRTHHASPKRSNAACTRETPSASTTTSFESSAPTVSRSKSSARSCRPPRSHTST